MNKTVLVLASAAVMFGLGVTGVSAATTGGQCYSKAVAFDQTNQNAGLQFVTSERIPDPCTGTWERASEYREPSDWFAHGRWVMDNGDVSGWNAAQTLSKYAYCADGRAQVAQYMGAIWKAVDRVGMGFWYNMPPVKVMIELDGTATCSTI